MSVAEAVLCRGPKDRQPAAPLRAAAQDRLGRFVAAEWSPIPSSRTLLPIAPCVSSYRNRHGPDHYELQVQTEDMHVLENRVRPSSRCNSSSADEESQARSARKDANRANDDQRYPQEQSNICRQTHNPGLC